MNLITTNSQTMSSRQISDLTGKQHGHVKRDIASMFLELEIDLSKYGSIYTDLRNRSQTEYFLDRELTDCLLTGYSAIARMAVIKRWKELENKEQETPEQLMARALISAQSVIDDKNKLLEQAKPAIELHESIVNDDSTLCLRDAGKKLQVKPNKFIEWLRDEKYLTPLNMAYQAKINAGYMLLSTTEHNGKPRTNTRITGKGFAHFGKKLAELRFKNPDHAVFYK